MQHDLQYLSSAALADLFQVKRQLSIAGLVVELIRRGWHAVSLEAANYRSPSYHFQFALTLPEYPPGSSALQLWEISDDELTWDGQGRSQLGSMSLWPRHRVIVTPASLCAVLRALDGTDRLQAMYSTDPAFSDDLLFLPDIVPLRDTFQQHYKQLSPVQQFTCHKLVSDSPDHLGGGTQNQPLGMSRQAVWLSNQNHPAAVECTKNMKSTGKQSTRTQKQNVCAPEPPAPAPAKLSTPTSQREQLHRILVLGWKPTVSVHCNGLHGRFIGGHDRDLFIQCTGPEYDNLPLVALEEGGCIMSCSQFEKKAGRSLSKKWKESIHVLGEGEGSRATLISWLKRQAAEKFGEAVVGKECWICWVTDGAFYRATVISYIPETAKHKVRYSDRFVEDLHLPAELVHWGEEKPEVPDLGPARPIHPPTKGGGGKAAASKATSAATSSQKRQSVKREPMQQLPYQLPPQPLLPPQAPLPQPHQHPLLPAQQQPQLQAVAVTLHGQPCSDVWQAYQDCLLDISTPAKARPPSRGPGSARSADLGMNTLMARQMLQQAQHLALCPSVDAPPPAGQLAGSSGKQSQTAGTTGSQPSSSITDPADLHQRSDSGPATKRQRVSELHRTSSWGSDMVDTQSGGQTKVRLHPPPPGGYDEQDVATVSRWMHALVVDVEEALRAYVAAEVGGSPDTVQLQSPAARFQALLVQSRGTEQFKGYYEALLARYMRHQDNPLVQQRKLVEFMMGALSQAKAAQPDSPVPGV